MITTSTCPEVHDLQRFVLGQLPEAEAEGVEQHLSRCGLCLETLKTLKKEDTLVNEMRAHATAVDEPRNEVVEGLAERFSRMPERLPADSDKTVAGSQAAPPSGEQTVAAEPSVPPPEDATEEIFDFLAAAQAPGEIGRLGPYRVLKVLGRGGMGLVFQAEDVHLQRLVALKVILPSLAASPAAKQRFLREARAMAAVEHDHIVPVFQVGEDRGAAFLAMPLLRGESLDDRLQREKQLPPADVLRIGREMAEGLAAAHERGLVHRDVKPSNVWLEGKRGRVKILDFGLVRAVEGAARLTQSGSIAGTPAYMAPEQANDEPVDARSDLFSLGCVLYRMATGEAAFKGASTLAVLRALAVETPRPPRELNPDLPPVLSDLIMMLLAKDPAGRPASAAAVAEALESIARGNAADIEATAVLERPTPAAPPRRKSIRWIGAAVAVAVLLLGAGGYLCGPAVYRVVTNQGQLVIEVNDPKVEVLLTEQGVKVRDAATSREYVLKPGTQTLPAGEYAIEVTEAGGLGFSAKEFSISRNGKAAVRVSLEKPATPTMEAVKVPTADELAKRPSAADALRREDIPTAALAWAGLGDARKAPAELVGILGDARFRLLDGATAPSYSLDGKSLAMTCGNRVMLFDAETGQYRRSLEGHTGSVMRVAFNPDGRIVASASADHTVKLWEVATGREVRTLCGHADTVFTVAFSPDGRTLASCSSDHTVRLWDAATGEQKRLMQDPDVKWWHLAFHPGGRLLASGGEQGAVSVWDVTDGALRHKARVKGGNTLVAFSGDGTTLAGGTDTEVKLWDVDGFKEKTALPAAGGGLLAFTADNRSLLTGSMFVGDGTPTVKRWDAATGKEQATLPLDGRGNWMHGRLSPDGKTFAVGLGDERIVRVYDAATGRPLVPAVGHMRGVSSVAFSPDGKTVASGSADRTVKLWDAATGKEIRTLLGHTDAVWYVAFSPDGKTVAAGGGDQTVLLWDAASGQRVQTLVGPTAAVEQIAFSPDGRLLAAASQDHIVYLWDVASGREMKTLRGHANQVRGVAFSPDGQTLASGDLDGAVILWDVASGKETRNLQHRASIQRLVFFPDGQTLAAAGEGGEVSLWSPATGVKRQTLTTQAPGYACGLSVRADGRMLAASGWEGTVTLWDLTAEPPTGQAWRLLPRFSATWGVAFSPEGRYLATANGDGTVRILRAPEHVRAEPAPPPSAPFRVDLKGLAEKTSMDATSFPPSWRREGVFAEVNGPGEANFPTQPGTRYVCEAEVELLRIRDSHLRIRAGEAEICLEWDEAAEMAQCKLVNWHGGNGMVSWNGSRYQLGERLRLKLVVVDGRRGILVNNLAFLEGRGSPADLGLRILSEGRTLATVYRCSCRAVEDDDLKALGWPLLPARPTLDPDVAAKRLQERTAKLDNKPVEGKRFVVGATGGPLTWIAPGEFDLGSRDQRVSEEMPKHHVRLTKSFWMGQYEVTQGEWAKLMPANPSRFQGSPFLPVDSVHREDALRFCKQLTDGEKAAGRIPDGYEYRLPTEAEWEYAGRAGSEGEFSVSPEQIWRLETSTQQPHEVGAFPPNAWGLYDMQGSVQEWCYDAWYSYPKPEAGTVENPVHPGNPAKDEFVVRGGAWWMSRDRCGISARDKNPSAGVNYGGFRIVLGPVIRRD